MVTKKAGFWAARSLIALVGISGLAWVYYAAIAAIPPIEWHGSAVYPSVVHAGDRVEITRQFTVHREIIVDIKRQLVLGNCVPPARCVQYDLPDSTFLLIKGEYNRTIPQTIPADLPPGRYNLQFELHWQNAVGYRYAVRHPPLSIEVIK